MAAIERLTTDIAGPFPPYRQRATCLSIPAVQRSSTAPEREHGAGYASPRLAIIQIMLMVEGRSRSIFLADRVNARGIAQSFYVGRPHLRAECMRGRTPIAKRIINDRIRRG